MMQHYDSYRYETNPPVNGGTRWASDDEIQEVLSKVNLFERHYAACGLPLICDGHSAYVNNTDSHSLIIGSTGSKKSRLFVMPMLQMIARAGESVIVTDPKGELYDRSSGLFAREGYRIQVLNFRDPMHSNGWNPLYTAYLMDKMGEHDKALQMFADISAFLYADKPGSKQDPFWNQKSRSIFQGLCQLMLEDPNIQKSQISFSTLAELMSNITDDVAPPPTAVMDIVRRELPPDSLARKKLLEGMLGSEKTILNVTTSMLAPFDIFFTSRSLMKMLATPEIDFREIGMKKTALFIIMPDEKTTLHALVGMAIKNCYEMLIDAAQYQRNKTLPVRVNYLLDEFSNIPTIPDMSSMITAARSRNIRFYLIVQSMQQLYSKYGEEAHTLRGNCNDWVFLTSRELSLLQELESLCGCDVKTGQPLITVSQLQRLNKESGEALVLCGRMYPYLTHLPDIDGYPFADVPPVPLPNLPELRCEPFSFEEYVDRWTVSGFSLPNRRNESEDIFRFGPDDDDQEDNDLYERLDQKFQALYGKKSD